MRERYIPIRPGILEYLLRGDMSAFEFGVYVIVHLQADYSSGIWRGSAPRIMASAPRGAKLREVQRALEHLADLGLLKHFHQHGQRGNFAFLINKFTVRSGALIGMRLNADKSESWQHPTYESCADVDADDSAHDDAQDAPIQEVRSKKEEKRKHLSASAMNDLPIADGFEEFYRAYPKHVSKDAALRAWRKVKPEERDAILARVELNKVGEWAGKEKQYIPNPSTWLNGRRWTDEILPGGTNGNRKQSTSEKALNTVAATRAWERENGLTN